MRLSQLWVYPVKSLAGIPLRSAAATPRGIVHDRRWLVVDEEGVFLTQREAPQMALVQPALEEGQLVLRHRRRPLPPLLLPLEPAEGPVQRVRVWDDSCEAVPVGDHADRWLTAALGRPCALLAFPAAGRRFSSGPFAAEKERAAFADGYPFLLVGEGSLEDLNARLRARGEEPLEMRRFRPNLVVAGSEAFAEDRWRRVRVGALEMRMVKPCARCAITTVDPDAGTFGKEPLRTLATFRRGGAGEVLFAQNVGTDDSGELRVGDAVMVLEEGGPASAERAAVAAGGAAPAASSSS